MLKCRNIKIEECANNKQHQSDVDTNIVIVLGVKVFLQYIHIVSFHTPNFIFYEED